MIDIVCFHKAVQDHGEERILGKRVVKELIYPVPMSYILSREIITSGEYYHYLKDQYYALGNDEDFLERYMKEFSHYKMLMATIEHKENETKYYFKEDLYSSRKIIAFSTDCLSTLHVMIRGKVLNVIAYMRSSDVKSLLPVDVYGILKSIQMGLLWAEWTEVKLIISIGSAHYYLDGTRDNPS